MLIVTNCPPGAFAKAVISTIEAVGTPPTIAIKSVATRHPARWQSLLFTQSRRSERRRSSRSSPWRHATRRVCKGCYFHNRGHRNVADHREQVRGDTPPGALAKAVIRTIEAVGTPPTIANKGAQALCLTNGGWGDKIRIYIFI